MIDDDYEKIKREIVFEKAAKAIKEDPKNWIKQLEDIGFEYFDDGDGDEEELEEKLAKPENPNQELLVDYFDGKIELSAQMLDAFLTEKDSEQFYYDTDPDGFDALYELSEKYGPDSDKGKIAREILRRQESEPDSIDF
ncbi:MAG: hypothetical protein KJP23_28015 [Deltaproteobacteria bacterium]|nr:hypothetical protein [Deltaproteobacteria bacterium]